MTFAGRKMTVQHRHQCLERPGAKPCLKALDRLRCQRNFRHQDNRPLTLLQRMCNRLQIHFGFPTPCYSVQQEKIAGLPVNLLQSCSLFGIQVQWLGGDDFLVGVGIAFGNLRGNFHEALVLQLAHGLGSGAGELKQLLHGQ